MLQTTLNASLLSGPKIARDLTANRILIATSDQGDFLIVRYAEDGVAGNDVRWGLRNSTDVPTAILLRADGGFVVSGYKGGNIHAAYRTLRFDAAHALVFSDRETGDIGNLFTPAWLAPDAAGNTYVAGGPESACGLFTFRIWKLDVAGQRLWTHSGPVAACGSAEPIGFELLPDGSTIVVNRTGVQDFGVVRINADGSTRWARQWGGPNAAHSATPLAFAVNAAGRVRVSGFMSVGSSTIAAIAEWTAEGSLCIADTFDPNRATSTHLLGTDWVVGADSQFNAVSNNDAVLSRYPAVMPCIEDAVFRDGFDQISGF